jgi:hypothetical protein
MMSHQEIFLCRLDAFALSDYFLTLESYYKLKEKFGIFLYIYWNNKISNKVTIHTIFT